MERSKTLSEIKIGDLVQLVEQVLNPSKFHILGSVYRVISIEKMVYLGDQELIVNMTTLYSQKLVSAKLKRLRKI